MYFGRKLEFIKRRIFDAQATRRIPIKHGLSEQEQIKRAFDLKLFTEEELNWLEHQDKAFERSVESRITGSKPSVGFLHQVLVRVGGIESWVRMMLHSLPDVDVAGMAITRQDMIDATGIDIPVGVGIDECAALASRVDVLVVSNEFAVEEVLAKATRRPTVVFVHHGDVTCMWSSKAVLSQARSIDILVTVHPAAGSRFRDVIPRVECIPNAVDPARCIPQSATMTRKAIFSEIGLPLNAKVVLYSGRFAMDKGYPMVRAIGERLPTGVYMVLMGGEPDVPHPKLRFVGLQRYPGTWYNAADIGVSTSIEEGCGLSMLEMAHVGLPFVATRRGVAAVHPTMARIMPDGATVTDWVNAITEDFGDPLRVQQRVAIAKSIVAEHYSAERFGNDWNRLLSSIEKNR